MNENYKKIREGLVYEKYNYRFRLKILSFFLKHARTEFISIESDLDKVNTNEEFIKFLEDNNYTIILKLWKSQNI